MEKNDRQFVYAHDDHKMLNGILLRMDPGTPGQPPLHRRFHEFINGFHHRPGVLLPAEEPLLMLHIEKISQLMTTKLYLVLY